MARHKDANWDLTDSVGLDGASLAVLMDIRDELKRLNKVLQCPNFIAVPRKLDDIEAELRQIRLNTRKKKRPVVGTPSLRVVTG